MAKHGFCLAVFHRRCATNIVANPDWKTLCDMASSEVEAVLNDLPEALRERVQQLPITFEHKPNRRIAGGWSRNGRVGRVYRRGICRRRPYTDVSAYNVVPGKHLGPGKGRRKCLPGGNSDDFLHELGQFLELNEDELTERGLKQPDFIGFFACLKYAKIF